jgi:hypothetical protein
MADFCKQCSEHMFGPGTVDLDGISTPADTAKGLYASALCESCGPCQVDHTGRCITHTDDEHDSINRTGRLPDGSALW